MGVNTASASSSGFAASCGGYKVRDPNISPRNQRRLDKKKKKNKSPLWEGEHIVYLNSAGYSNE